MGGILLLGGKGFCWACRAFTKGYEDKLLSLLKKWNEWMLSNSWSRALTWFWTYVICLAVMHGVFSLGYEINNRVDVEEEVYRAIEFTLEEFHLHRDVDDLVFKFEMERDKERRRDRENGEDKNTWRLVAWLVSGVVLKVALETVYQDGKKRLFG